MPFLVIAEMTSLVLSLNLNSVRVEPSFFCTAYFFYFFCTRERASPGPPSQYYEDTMNGHSMLVSSKTERQSKINFRHYQQVVRPRIMAA